MLIAKQLRVANVDRVIALKYPAYLVEHPCKVVWLLHQYRQAYDLYDAGQTDIPPNEEGETLRRAIRTADEQAFTGAHRLFAIAEARKRLKRYNGLDAEELSAPLNDPELFSCRPAEGYIFAGGRVNDGKRQSLLIRALRHAPSVRLVVAGPVEDGETQARLIALAEAHGVADRLTLDLRFLERTEIADLVNRSTAVAYIPFQEDSVGYVTLEAFQASKPVVTADDTGGVLSIVRDNETGFVSEPTPEAIGASMERAIAEPETSRELGLNARERLEELDLSWSKVLSRLLS
ncbi:glycosyltransferase family 4 protein [Fulvimarina endophytica]|nr:glycosyltransferase family 4 protein [Fulvimarina endophytica]